MQKAYIYKPNKTATQSGKANAKSWVVEFEHDGSRYVENLMGWTGSRDMLQEVKLSFPTQQQAINFVKKNYPSFEISLPNERRREIKKYEDNFID